MIYITGDTYRDFSRLNNLDYKDRDPLILLGNFRINYCPNDENVKYKQFTIINSKLH